MSDRWQGSGLSLPVNARAEPAFLLTVRGPQARAIILNLESPGCAIPDPPCAGVIKAHQSNEDLIEPIGGREANLFFICSGVR